MTSSTPIGVLGSLGWSAFGGLNGVCTLESIGDNSASGPITISFAPRANIVAALCALNGISTPKDWQYSLIKLVKRHGTIVSPPVLNRNTSILWPFVKLDRWV